MPPALREQSVKRINPFDSSQPYLLPCNVYPFICGSGQREYVLARTNLKLCCLLHDNVHFPGSIAVENPFVRDLALDIMPFLEAGTVKLDLRSSCTSFSELVRTKFDERAAPQAVRMAELLDARCPSVLFFDARDTAASYAKELGEVVRILRRRARDPSVVSHLDRASDFLLATRSSLPLVDVEGLLKGTHLNHRFATIARVLYSLHGARVTNSEAVLPDSIWNKAFPRGTKDVDISARKLTPKASSDLQFANEVVMDYFAVDAGHIDKLSATAILDLKREPLTNRYIRELNDAVSEASRQSRKQEDFTDTFELIRDRAVLIRSVVRNRCESERRALKRESLVLGATDEVGGIAGGLFGLSFLRKGYVSLARRLARKHHQLAFLDYTSTPLVTHVSRFQQLLAGRES
jgi:hypothetical protein